MKFLDGIENIEASESLKKKVKRKFFESRIVSLGKGVGSIAGAFVIFVSLGVNMSPAFAEAMTEVPILKDFVKIVTVRQYENKIGNSEAVITVPKIEGLNDEKLMEEINRELGENANALIDEFEREAALLLEEFGTEAHMGVESSYMIKTDTEDIYAIDIYFYNKVGSSSTTHKFYTINKKTGELITLKSLFKSDADYTQRLTEIITEEMKRRNEEEGAMFFVGEDDVWKYEGVQEDCDFYINEKGNLVICYDKYEVAPGAAGCPEFEIDYELIEDILQ